MSKGLPRSAIQWRGILYACLALVALQVVNILFFRSDLGYLQCYPHPYWIIIFFVALRYGIWESLLTSGILAAAFTGWVFFNNGNPYYFSSIRLFTDFRDPFLFLIVSTLISESTTRAGKVKERFRSALRRKSKELFQLNDRLDQSEKALDRVNAQISSQFSDVLDLFDAVSATRRMNIGEIQHHFLKTLSKFLHAEKTSYFQLSDTGKLIPRYRLNLGEIPNSSTEEPSSATQEDPLLNEVLRTKQVAYLSHILENHSLLDAHSQSLIAGPIVTSEGRIEAIVSIEKISFTAYNPSTLKLFKILLNWWGHLLDERHYLDALYQQYIFSEKKNLYTYDYFTRRFQLEFEKVSASQMPLTIGYLTIQEYEQLIPEKCDELEVSILQVFAYFLTPLDLIAATNEQGQYILLFPGKKQAEAVQILKNAQDEIMRYEFRPYLNPDRLLGLTFVTKEHDGKQTNTEFINSLFETKTKAAEI